MAQAVVLGTALALLCAFVRPTSAESTILLASNILYSMRWTHNASTITITLTANWSGYLGLGFSPNGGMAGADIVLLYPRGGSIVIEDRHGVGKSLPPLDAKQDYKLINSSFLNGQITATFVRALDTCDEDDAVLKAYTTKMIYAYGLVDASGAPQYHGANRGVVSAYLLSTVPAAPNDSSIFTIDPIPQTISIPTLQTTYWCSVVPFPRVQNKSHIIETEPVITPGNEDIVHHILVYSCESVNLNFTSFDCLNSVGGGNLFTCSSLLAVWAVGGGAYRFPPNAGLPVGGQNTMQYILIQTHYSNMMHAPGRTDASYVRFKATPNLRQYDAGILDTGVVGGMLVPPNVTQMLVAGYCAPDCFNTQLIPDSGITVFSVFLHAHLLGRRITLRKLQSTNKNPPLVIADDIHYDFDYQDIWNLDVPVKVMPGDTLQTICTMSSSGRSSATQGGTGTFDEMCLSFAFYYPKTNLTLCLSAPRFSYTANDSVYALLGKNMSSFDWYYRQTNDGLVGARWSEQLTNLVQSEYFNGTAAYFCSATSTGDPFVMPLAAAEPLPSVSTTSQSCVNAFLTSTTAPRSDGHRAPTKLGAHALLCALAAAAASVAAQRDVLLRLD